MKMLNEYCQEIKEIMLEMVAQKEIDYDYNTIQKCTEQDKLDISSIDKVKIVIKLEVKFDVTIDDDYLGKMTTIEEFAQAVMGSLNSQEAKTKELDAIIQKVLTD